MIIRRYLPILSLLFIPLSSVLQAQSSVVSAGGDAAGSNGSAAYSIGLAAYAAITSEDGTVYLGVQQPYPKVMVGLHETNVSFEATIYPNPTAYRVYLKLQQDFYEQYNEGLTYKLAGSNGQVYQSNPVQSMEQTIILDDMAPGTYMLSILQNENHLRTFKIIKIN